MTKSEFIEKFLEILESYQNVENVKSRVEFKDTCIYPEGVGIYIDGHSWILKSKHDLEKIDVFDVIHLVYITVCTCILISDANGNKSCP